MICTGAPTFLTSTLPWGHLSIPSPNLALCRGLPFQGLGHAFAQRAAEFASPLLLQVLCSHVAISVKPFLIIFLTSPFFPQHSLTQWTASGFFFFFFPLRTFHILTDCWLSPFIFCLLLEHNATRVDILMSHCCLQHQHLCLSHHRPFITSTC